MDNRPRGGICPRTGLAVPECSCRSCLEEMLRHFRPDLLPGEIKVTRLASRPKRNPGSERRRPAA